MKLSELAAKYGTLVIGIAVVAVVLFMVIPLPPVLLDLLLAMNITLALIILLVAIHVMKPLDFSSFPTVLLITTLFRLSLNIASTRLILIGGNTGTDAAGKEWACGKAAKQAMARLVEGKIVVCQERARDSYKRSIAVCLAGGRDLGRELVAAGLAVAYRRYSKR